MRVATFALLLGSGALAAVVMASGCGAFEGETGPASDASVAVEGGPSTEAGAGDAGVEGDGSGAIPCGARACVPGSEVCCSALSSGEKGCLPRSGDAGVCTVLVRECDDLADCAHAGPTAICCGRLGSDKVTVQAGSECRSYNDCKKDGDRIVMCDPEAPAPCLNNAPCLRPDGGNYAFCQGL